METTEEPQLAIVIADDSPAIRELLSVLVETGGVGRVVGLAENGLEAVELATAHSPDLALLDVDMPRLNGFAAAEAIRAYRPQTEIVLHTGHDDPDIRERAQAIGIPLVSKIRDFAALTAILSERSAPGGQPAELTAVVLAALERGAQESVTVLDADGNAVYYDSRAAEIVGLPYPPRFVPHDELRRLAEHVTATGDARPIEERPMFRVLAEKRVVEGIVYSKYRGGIVAWASRAVPIQDADGEVSAAAVYWRRVESSAPRGDAPEPA
ncbi:MAG: response regulator [Actinobacteria bacterium]|nr:response regulator [Actinomycetota bacterium]MBV8479936.1 response regulator [Actinomycetota bacterium]